MAEKAPIQIGVDFDGVVVKKPKPYDLLRRPTKMGLPTISGAVEHLASLQEEEDVHVLGIYTVRPEWLRGGQTRRQIERRAIPVERVVHTANSPEEKIAQLLIDASGGERDQRGAFVVPPWLDRIVLIDDSVNKVLEGAHQLAGHRPELAALQARFTLAAFNYAKFSKISGHIIPGVIHVVGMHGWADDQGMLGQVRRHVSRSQK